MKNKIALLLLSLTLLFTGCAELVSAETKEVHVTVVDTHHTPMWIQPIYTGKTFVNVTHPATYMITVEYEGVEYDISGRETYEMFKDSVRQTVTGILEIQNYDDGSVRYDVVKLVKESED